MPSLLLIILRILIILIILRYRKRAEDCGSARILRILIILIMRRMPSSIRKILRILIKSTVVFC